MKLSPVRRVVEMNAICLALLSLSLFAPGQEALAQGKRVKINIQLIEATTKSADFDKRLEPFKKDLAPYTGARVVDQLEKEVELGASVSVEFKGAPPLRVTLESFDEKAATVRLKHEIRTPKVSTLKTEHRKSNATLFVRPPPQNPDTAIFFAVTPKL